MDLRRLRLGELVVGAAALGLLAALFLHSARDPGGLLRGWSAVGPVVDVLLVVAVGFAAALVFATVTRRPAAIPIGAAVLTTSVGAVVVLVLLVRVVLLDDALGGAYLGLGLMLLIPVGGWIAMADERRDAPQSAPPDLPRRPAPPAEA